MDLENITQEDLAMIQILGDPVTWAKVTLNWEARTYQADVLRDTSNRIVLRQGRRSGKCLSEESKVITDKGPIKVKDLFSMDESSRPAIVTFDENTHKMGTTKNYHVFTNGVKPLFRLRTKTGRVNVITDNHPFLVIEDGKLTWKELKDLSVGDRIASPSSYQGLIPGTPLGAEESRLLGYLCGDGGTNYSDAIRFTNFDKEIVKDMEYVLSKWGCRLSEHEPGQYGIVYDKWQQNPVLDFSRAHGVQGKKAVEKEVPEAIMNGTEEDIANFLGAYWDCDGWLCSNSKTYDSSHKVPKIEIGVCSASKNLAYGVQHLLLRIGILSSIREKKVKYKDRYNDAWSLVICGRDNQARFMDKIPLKAKEIKKDHIRNLIQQQNPSNNNYLDSIPKGIWEYITEKQNAMNMSDAEVCGNDSKKNIRLRRQYSPSRKKVLRYAQSLEDDNLKQIASSSIIWDEIKAIDPLDEGTTYDLTVPDTHTLVAGDIISHNSDVMVVKALYLGYIQPGGEQGRRYRILMIAPMQEHVDEFFARMRELIRNSEELSDSVVEDIKNPNRITFGNGTEIRGITAGTKSGAKAMSVRGKGGDVLLYDEMDYLSDDDIDNSYAIVQEKPNVFVMGASTPTGRRSRFHGWCHDKKRWKEYHIPSTMSPHWNAKMEQELKEQFPGTKFLHEVLAEFGEEEAGVIQKQFIDASRILGEELALRYQTIQNPMRRKGPRILGVDWDKTFVPTG